MDDDLLPRRSTDLLLEFVEAFRVVVVGGPRQAGKTTLIQQFQESRGGSFASLDDDATLASALDDPMTFASYGDRPRVIDEVQRGGEGLVRSIKYAVDRDNSRGQFVLSGSSRFLTVPTISESLAGRAVFIELWPLSAAERTGTDVDAVDMLFDIKQVLNLKLAHHWTRAEYFELFCEGGYPEAVATRSGRSRQAWFDAYLSTVVLRDVADFADLRHANAIPRLVGLLAARSGSGLVVADLARALGIDQATVKDYLGYLDVVYLTSTLRPWSANLTSRLVKTPKVYLTDSGLAASLLKVSAADATAPGHPQAGLLTETFVLNELTRQMATSDAQATLHYYRDRDGREIDFILERRDGSIVALEVKSSGSGRSDSFKHLAWMRDKLGEKFVAGYLLHLGDTILPGGDRLATLPVSTLWGGADLLGRPST